MPAIFHFGLNILFDNRLITPEFLCDSYVIVEPTNHVNQMIYSSFLCDGHVIGSSFFI